VFRYIAGLVSGFIAGFVAVGLIELIAIWLYPLPRGFDPNDLEAMEQHIASLPAGAFALVLIAHAIGAFLAGLVCCAIAMRLWWPGVLALGGVFIAAGIMNIVQIPHPLWFGVVDLALYVPAAIAGGALGARLTAKPLTATKPLPAQHE